MRNDADADLDALAQEELSASELTEILTRLSGQEFGSENPTIAAVAEATGASIILVAKILTEMRRQNISAIFGSEISQQRQELDRLAREMKTLRAITTQVNLATSELEATIRNETSVESERRMRHRVWFADPALQASWELRVSEKFQLAREQAAHSRNKSK